MTDVDEQEHRPLPKTQGSRLQVHALTTLKNNAGPVYGLEFSPDGSILISMANDLHIWKEKGLEDWSSIWAESHCAYRGFPTDSTLLLSKGFEDFTLLSLDAHVLQTFHRNLKGIWGNLYTPDGSRFVMLDDTQCYIWDHTLAHLLAAHELPCSMGEIGVKHAQNFCFSPDGKKLFFLSQGRIFCCHFEWEELRVSAIEAVSERRLEIEVIELSPNGRLLAGSNTKRDCVDLYDARALTYLTSLTLPQEEPPQMLAYSPEEDFLACAGWEGNVVIWDLKSYQTELAFAAHPGLWTEQAQAIEGLAWSPRGDLLATGGASRFLANQEPDYTVKLWRIETQNA